MAVVIQANPSTRVMVWVHARTRSTAFELSLASVPTFKILHEPYYLGFWLGEERRYTSPVPPIKGYKKVEVKSALEADYPDHEVVICKDGPYGFNGKKDYEKYLPQGFIHTFMIRDPIKTVPSFYNLLKVSIKEKAWDCDLIETCKTTSGNIQPVYDLFKYVKDDLGQTPIIVESDDLVNSPREVIQKYCRATGIPFYESMLKWEPGNISHWPDILTTQGFVHSFQRAIDSSSFEAQETPLKDAREELPKELTTFIEESRKPYYEMTKFKL
ncbi:uncharacterized protein LOC144361500 [Saccoglossus kowalevskii]